MIELHAFEDPRAQSDALAKAVGDALQASLTAQATGTGHVTLAVSGGSIQHVQLARSCNQQK